MLLLLGGDSIVRRQRHIAVVLTDAECVGTGSTEAAVIDSLEGLGKTAQGREAEALQVLPNDLRLLAQVLRRGFLLEADGLDLDRLGPVSGQVGLLGGKGVVRGTLA